MKEKLLIKLILFRQDKVEKIIVIIIKVKLILFGQDKVEKKMKMAKSQKTHVLTKRPGFLRDRIIRV